MHATVRRVTSVLAAFSLFAAFAAGTARAETKWSEFVSETCKCAITMPGAPTENKQKFPTDAGEVEATLYMLESDGGSVAYLMGFNDFPAELVAKSDPQTMLDGARDGAVRNVGGKLLEEKKITINGSPGRELKVEAPGENLVYARVYLVKNRLHQMLVVFPKSKLREGDVKKFLTSFRLTTKK